MTIGPPGRNAQLKSSRCDAWGRNQERGMVRMHAPLTERSWQPGVSVSSKRGRAEGSGGDADVWEAEGQREAYRQFLNGELFH